MARRIDRSGEAHTARLQVGARLRQKRQQAGLSLRELAALTNMHFTTLSRIEAGIFLLSVDRLIILTSVLGCDPADVLGEQGCVLPTTGALHA